MRIRRDGGERGGEERGRKRRRRKELVVVAGQMLRGERDVTCDLRRQHRPVTVRAFSAKLVCSVKKKTR